MWQVIWRYIRDLGEFIWVVGGHWQHAVTGTVLAVILSVAAYYADNRVGKRVFWSVVAFGFVFASFGAWRDVHNAFAAENIARKIAEENYQRVVADLAAEHSARQEAEKKYLSLTADRKRLPTPSLPGKTEPRLYITVPEKDDTEVEWETDVSIRSDVSRPDLYLWLIMHSEKGGDFVFADCPANNLCRSAIPHPLTVRNWDSTRKMLIGGELDEKYLPLQYTIRLVAVDQEDNDFLVKNGRNYTEGLKRQVHSVIPEAQRTVIRKKKQATK